MPTPGREAPGTAGIQRVEAASARPLRRPTVGACGSRSSDRWRYGPTTVWPSRSRAPRNGCSSRSSRRARRASSAPTGSLEALWDGDLPVSARKSLQVHLVHLRSALEPDRPRGSTGRYVVRRGSGYALATAPEDVDALRIADLAARGRARLSSGDAGEAARLLSDALGLWRGEPYGDWPDASFAEAERRRLAEVRVGALTALLEARLSLGEHTDVVAEAERLLAEDPLQEEWWRLLVLALYRSGRQGDALAAVARARAVLAEQSVPIPGPGSGRSRRRCSPRTPCWTSPSRRRSGTHPPTSRSAPTRAWPPTRRATPPCSTAGAGWSPGCVGRLVDAPLLVVSGASGAGKSSLVRAGLVPALAGGALPGSAEWQAVVVAPGRRPVDALAGLTGDRPPVAPGRAGLRPVRGALGARDRPCGARGVPGRGPGSARRRRRRPVRGGRARRPRRPAGRARGLHRAARRRAGPRSCADRGGTARRRP